MADNTLDIVLRFLVDKRSQAEAKNALKSVTGTTGGGQFAGFEKVAKSAQDFARLFNISIEQAAETMSRSPFLSGDGEVFSKSKGEILGAVQAFEQLGNEANSTDKAIQNIDRNVQRAGKTMQRAGSSMMMGMTGFTLAMTGMQLTKFGSSILSPIQDFTKYAGMANGASGEWLTTMERIEKSNLRIGQSMASTVLPLLEKGAEIAESISDVAAANPALVQAAAGLAVGGIAVGQLLQVGGSILSGIAALKSLGMLVGTASAASAAGATGAAGAAAGAASAGGAAAILSSAMPVIGTVLLGAAAAAILATVAARLLDKSGVTKAAQEAKEQAREENRKINPRAIGNQQEAKLQAQLNVAIDKGDAAEIERLKNEIRQLGQAAGGAAEELGAGAAAVDAFINYRKQEAAAEEQYNKERSQIVEDYAKQRAEIEESYEKSRADLMRDFAASQADALENLKRSQTKTAADLNKSEGRTEADYYANRAKLAAQYNLNVQRAEEDHQRRMLELQRDHNDRVADLTDERDALGLFRELRDYERTRQDAEDDYAIEAARRSQDFALRMSEMEVEFAQARARRMADYQQRRADEQAEYAYRQAKDKERLTASLKELDENHKAEILALEKQNNERLNELARNYQEERNKRRTAFADQIRDLDASLLGERDRKNAYYRAMALDLQAWIKVWEGQLGTANPPATTTKGSRAIGGYVNAGLWQMHDDEFVLNANTTRMAERIAGGKLDQGGFMRLLLQGGQQQTSVTINDHRRFDSRLSAQDRRQIQRDTTSLLAGALGNG